MDIYQYFTIRKILIITFLLILLQPCESYLLCDVCPEQPQLRMRSHGICNATASNYICVFDENTKLYVELCSSRVEVQNPGFKTVHRGSFDSQICSFTRYQPYAHTSDIGSECVFRKSECNEEGQVVADTGTSIKDKSCQCDYTKGYAFVQQPSQMCKCSPSVEDCTCFKKTCNVKDQFLTPDYTCISKKKIKGNFHCRSIVRSKNNDIGIGNEETVESLVSEKTTTDVNWNKMSLIMAISAILLVWLSSFVVCIFFSVGNRILYAKTSPPILTIGMMTKEVKYGESVILSCSVNASPPADNVFWEIVMEDGSPATVYTNVPGYRGGNVKSPSLQIDFCTLSHTGRYRCVAANAIGTSRSQYIALTVTGGPPILSIDTKTKEVKYGESVTLTCSVDASPPAQSVFWETLMEDGSASTVNTKVAGYQGGTVENPSLYIDVCTLVHAGRYRCVATNAIDSSRSSYITLTVRGGLPILTVDIQTREIDYGKPVELTCSINAFPYVTGVFWEILRPNGITSIVNTNIQGYTLGTVEDPSLKIKFCKLSDSGKYKCVATNAIGSSSSEYITLKVMESDTFFNIEQILEMSNFHRRSPI